MRKYLFGLFIALFFGVGFTSCLDDDNESTPMRYLEMGIVKMGETDEIRVLTDSELLLELDNYPASFDFEEEQRVMIQYSVSELNEENTTYDYLVDVYSVQEVRLKDVIELNEENRDTIGDDQIYINEVWVSGDFLNIDFQFYGDGKVHYINVVKDPDEQTDDPAKIYLQVRHDAREDDMEEIYRGIMSFRLEPLQVESLEEVELIFENQSFYSMPYSQIEVDYEYGVEEE
ncbi:NigD-like protein [Marinilabilia salmonicolor]|uniref:NigD-like protein n=1 Tax=Marinilabilia salmonicolor TaxID=989 RepID=A0A2T0XHC7_9BACT|nr:NigD-like protein [Marinilabilia salmonicolor]PRY98307.1 NigD-like protein [Marinilabilia salmonicolor]RCW33881.1 NigD-like protein [Marinilabilia salmonicolor]